MDQLTQYRDQIDTIDREIIRLFGERFRIVQAVGEYKKIHHMPPLQPHRWQEVLQSRMEIAKDNTVDPEWIKEIWESIHTYALRLEEDV